MAILLPQDSLVLNAYAVLVGQTPGNAAFNEHKAFIAANGSAVYTQTLSSVFANYTNAQLATLLITNLGLTGIVPQADAEAYLVANGADRVGAMLKVVDVLLAYNGDHAGLLAAKTAYTNAIEGSYNYSIDAAHVAGATLSGTIVSGGQTFTLTKGLDNFPGSNGNDTFIGSVDSGNAELNTVSPIDILNGSAGTDTFKLAAATALGTANLPNLSNVEIIEVDAADAVILDTSAVSGLTNLNLIRVGSTKDAYLDAGASTDISVAVKATTGIIDVDGGKNVNVAVTNIVTASGDIYVGQDSDAGGADTGVAAKGTVTVTATGAATAANNDQTLSAINVTGGTTIAVTQKATSDASAAAADKTGTTITQGAVNVTGDASTTTVTVKQDASVAEVVAVDAVAAKATTKEVVFTEAKKGDTVKIDFGTGELTFTANKDLTAAEVASAFANLAKGAVQGNASAALGIYTDATGGVSDNWTSGVVQTVSATQAKVVFSSSTKTADLSTAVTGTATATAQNLVTGETAVAAKTGVLGVTNGVVTIKDSAATGTIKTITVDGYAATSRIGGGGATDDTTSLETLNLSNSGFGYTSGKVSSAADIAVDDTAATLALNLEKVGFSSYYNGDASTTTVAAAVTLTAAPTTLNVKSTGNNYVDLTAAATETLNVSGTGLLDVSTTDLAGLKTVKVTETAGLKLNAGVNDTVESVDTTGTTGTVTVSINGDKATYTGGAGVDNVKVTNASTAISKAIDLGAGNDRLDLSATLVIDPTKEIKGGDGTDTLVLSAAAAVARTGGVTFQDKITSFEKLEVGALGTASTVNLDNLDDINYVISNGAAGTQEVQTLTVTADGADSADETITVTYDTDGSAGATTGTVVYTLGGVDAANAAAVATGLAAQLNADAGFAAVATASAASGAVTIQYTTADNYAQATAAAGGTVTTLAVAGATSTGGVAASSALLTLDKMLTGATVELKAAGDVEVKLGTDGSTDVVNFVTNAATGTTLGTATADKVETINIEAKDTDATATTAGVANVSTNTLELDADAAKTVNLSGAGNLTLTLSTATKEVTLIDGATATGILNVTTLASDTAATTVKGGLAADVLTAKGANDVLLGGAGNDTLKVVGSVASAVTLTGGDGVDSFDVSGFTAANAGAAATITDLVKGETIKFATDADANFASSKVTLIAEATFDNYVTEAAKAADAASAGDHGIAWFQYNGNTFIVQDVDGNAAFDNNTDIIVKITGTVDLSASSFNEVGQGTLLYI